MNWCSAHQAIALAGLRAVGKKVGAGRAALELSGDQARIAPQVGAVLQDRDAAIAAGHRHELGLGRIGGCTTPAS